MQVARDGRALLEDGALGTASSSCCRGVRRPRARGRRCRRAGRSCTGRPATAGAPLTLTLMAISRQSAAVRPPPSMHPATTPASRAGARARRVSGAARRRPGSRRSGCPALLPTTYPWQVQSSSGEPAKRSACARATQPEYRAGPARAALTATPPSSDGPRPPAGSPAERAAEAEEGGVADDTDQRDQQRLASQGPADVVHARNCALVGGRGGRERPDAAGGGRGTGAFPGRRLSGQRPVGFSPAAVARGGRLGSWTSSVAGRVAAAAALAGSALGRWPWRWPGRRRSVAVAVVWPSTFATTVTFVSPCFTSPVFWVDAVERVRLLVAVLAGQRHRGGAQLRDVAGLEALGRVAAVAVRHHEVAVEGVAQGRHAAAEPPPSTPWPERPPAGTAGCPAAEAARALLGRVVGAAGARPDGRAAAGRDHHRDAGRDRRLLAGPALLRAAGPRGPGRPRRLARVPARPGAACSASARSSSCPPVVPTLVPPRFAAEAVFELCEASAGAVAPLPGRRTLTGNAQRAHSDH